MHGCIAVAPFVNTFGLCREASTRDKKIGWEGVCRMSSCSWEQ